jgi:hypothetical protein
LGAMVVSIAVMIETGGFQAMAFWSAPWPEAASYPCCRSHWPTS